MEVRAPTRVAHQYVQRLNASAAAVFPLLCPVREAEWVPHWDPLVVLTSSGVAEDGCIFVTADAGRESTWVVIEHQIDTGIVEMVKVTPGYLVTRLRITVRDTLPARSEAVVTYTFTALGAEGAQFVAQQTPEAYQGFMREWEEQLNAHLEHT
jgi:hypothetical protein